MKGDARDIGLRELQVAAQSLEYVLDELRNDPSKVDRASIDNGLQHLDRVREQYKASQDAADIERSIESSDAVLLRRSTHTL